VLAEHTKPTALTSCSEVQNRRGRQHGTMISLQTMGGSWGSQVANRNEVAYLITRVHVSVRPVPKPYETRQVPTARPCQLLPATCRPECVQLTWVTLMTQLHWSLVCWQSTRRRWWVVTFTHLLCPWDLLMRPNVVLGGGRGLLGGTSPVNRKIQRCHKCQPQHAPYRSNVVMCFSSAKCVPSAFAPASRSSFPAITTHSFIEHIHYPLPTPTSTRTLQNQRCHGAKLRQVGRESSHLPRQFWPLPS